MADIEIFDIVYSKAQVDAAIQVEEDRALAAEALKLDASQVGGDNGIPQLVGGFLQSGDIDWADNAEAEAGTSDVKVMSPVRVAEYVTSYLQENSGLTSVYTSASQANTANIAASKITYFNTDGFTINGHVTSDGVDQELDVANDGNYRISVNLECDAAVDTAVYLQIYVDGSPVGVEGSFVGLGTGKPVNVVLSHEIALLASNAIAIYSRADADATSFNVTASNVSVERLIYG